MNSKRMEDILLMCGVKSFSTVCTNYILLRSTMHIVNPVQLVDTI